MYIYSRSAFYSQLTHIVNAVTKIINRIVIFGNIKMVYGINK